MTKNILIISLASSQFYFEDSKRKWTLKLYFHFSKAILNITTRKNYFYIKYEVVSIYATKKTHYPIKLIHCNGNLSVSGLIFL